MNVYGRWTRFVSLSYDSVQFKEISFAYEVLSDPEKRQTYDRYGEKGLREGGGPGTDFDL